MLAMSMGVFAVSYASTWTQLAARPGRLPGRRRPARRARPRAERAPAVRARHGASPGLTASTGRRRSSGTASGSRHRRQPASCSPSTPAAAPGLVSLRGDQQRPPRRRCSRRWRTGRPEPAARALPDGRSGSGWRPPFGIDDSARIGHGSRDRRADPRARRPSELEGSTLARWSPFATHAACSTASSASRSRWRRTPGARRPADADLRRGGRAAERPAPRSATRSRCSASRSSSASRR